MDELKIVGISEETETPCGSETNEYPSTIKVQFPDGTILKYAMEWQIPEHASEPTR